jgi:hypothetical protein
MSKRDEAIEAVARAVCERVHKMFGWKTPIEPPCARCRSIAADTYDALARIEPDEGEGPTVSESPFDWLPPGQPARVHGAIRSPEPDEGGRITHGRHCTCSACARQDWSEPQLAACGMHGPSCRPVYAPLGPAGSRAEPDVEGAEA